MAVTAETIENLIKKAYPDAKIKLTDLAGDNDHWSLEITYAGFSGKSKIEQHKMVYAALGDKMKAELHALQIKTNIS